MPKTSYELQFFFSIYQGFSDFYHYSLDGHVVGSCWYLFGVQRVSKCLKDACTESRLFFNCTANACKQAIDCGRGSNETILSRHDSSCDFARGLSLWQNNSNASACLSKDSSDSSKNFSFNYGIYQQAPLITKRQSIVVRYIYSLFWGFQQISTLAGNQVPSDFVWEVLFTMGIIGLGLLLFALLIGNMQNFLLALGRRRLEMQLRRRDVERWMSHRRLPEYLRRQVRQAERFNWAATQGVNEEELLVNLPENLQREIRRHLFTFLKKKLRQKLYIDKSYIQQKGCPIEKMVFIVRGEMKSEDADENESPLSEGDVCGEELLTWYLEHSSLVKGWFLLNLAIAYHPHC
ncbi:hypothetical protein Taro_049671 [Colocasia esculenta]|uniref:Cyclic nucleotide-binding domain-containing protein n=1 Tax=Colocasia esculenta TaxID=4460 RepID=A0A843XBN3_COLES|nr:hypothetical protein [Colocasia esculenta]